MSEPPSSSLSRLFRAMSLAATRVRSLCGFGADSLHAQSQDDGSVLVTVLVRIPASALDEDAAKLPN